MFSDLDILIYLFDEKGVDVDFTMGVVLVSKCCLLTPFRATSYTKATVDVCLFVPPAKAFQKLSTV